jgi:hypothetical protein
MKIVQADSKLVTLVKGNKKIQRPYVDYKTNQKMWEFRGYKLEENEVKDKKVVELKPKRKKRKNVRINLEKD